MSYLPWLHGHVNKTCQNQHHLLILWHWIKTETFFANGCSYLRLKIWHIYKDLNCKNSRFVFCTNVFYGKIENRDQGDLNATNYDNMQKCLKRSKTYRHLTVTKQLKRTFFYFPISLSRVSILIALYYR